MPTDKVVTKFINDMLGEIGDRAFKYKRMSQDRKRTPRERAINKVIWLEYGSLYNWLRKRASIIKPELSANIDYDIVLELNSIMLAPSEEIVDDMIKAVFDSDRAERLKNRKLVENNILLYMAENPHIAQKVAKDAQNIKAMLAKKAAGNPRLGGFTRAAIAKGYAPEAAKYQAQLQLEEIEAEETGRAILHDPEYRKAIEEVTNSKSKTKTKEDYLAMLEPSNEAPEETQVQSGEPDFSDFDSE